jgi:hypothetical protein
VRPLGQDVHASGAGPWASRADAVSRWTTGLSHLLQPWLHSRVTSGDRPATGEWVLLAYRLPREPSGPRTTLWRRLKRLGVAQIADGLVALPADARTREQLEWLADEVVEATGTAGLWVARPGTLAQERELATAMARARAREYQDLAAQCREAGHRVLADRVRALRRLRTEWRAIGRRDFFPPPEREVAAAALRDLADAVSAAGGSPADARVPEPAP